MNGVPIHEAAVDTRNRDLLRFKETQSRVNGQPPVRTSFMYELESSASEDDFNSNGGYQSRHQSPQNIRNDDLHVAELALADRTVKNIPLHSNTTFSKHFNTLNANATNQPQFDTDSTDSNLSSVRF